MIENHHEKAASVGTEVESHKVAGHAKNLLSAEALQSKGACSALVNDQSQFNTLDKLSHASAAQLDCLYNNSSAGKIPVGDTKGIPLFMPGSIVGDVVNTVAGNVWHGKVFEDGGKLTNKIFDTHLFNASVSQKESWLDGKSATVIDYKGHSGPLTSWIRDEIREVRPGIYLGQLHNQSLPFLPHSTNVTYFALDNRHKK